MNRLDAYYASFVRRFAAKSPLAPFSSEHIDRVESELGIALPNNYRAFIQKYGAIRCGDMLDIIVDHESDLWDILSFSSAEEIIESTKTYVGAGMRDGLICFASDSMGNMFCFQREDIQHLKDDSSIWLFDHDFCEDSEISLSFEAWISSYLELPSRNENEA